LSKGGNSFSSLWQKGGWEGFYKIFSNSQIVKIFLFKGVLNQLDGEALAADHNKREKFKM